MANEYERPIGGFLTLMMKALAQIRGLFAYAVCTRIQSDVGIISKDHDPGLRDLLREEISQPQLLTSLSGPGSHGMVDFVAGVQAMNSNNTVEQGSQHSGTVVCDS